MESKTLVLLTVAIFFISPSSSSTTTTPTTRSRRFSKIYAFGDSYTDTGNIKLDLPYGMTFFHHPSNRLSDGRLVIDFVTEALSLPYLPPYLDKNSKNSSHGVNFAVGGATAIDHAFYVKNNITTLNFTPLSINNEVVWFNKFLESHGCKNTLSPQCKALMDGALFWVGEIGANDYLYTFGSSVPAATVQDLAIRGVTGLLQALLKIGAKNIVVQGLPMTGCLSLAMTIAPSNDRARDEFGCVANANKQSYTHNLLLQSRLQDLRRQYPASVISYADHWNAYRVIMKNQQRYGFKEPFRACCGSGTGPYNFDLFAPCGSQMASPPCSNPSQYINWDGAHLTESMYKAVADLLLYRGYTSPAFNIVK